MKGFGLNVSVLVERDGAVLLLQRASHEGFLPGMWEFPGGKARPAEESPQEAAAREFLEECGTPIRVLEPVGCFTFNTRGALRVDIVFRAELDVPSIRLSDAHQAYAWVDQAQLPDYPVSSEVRRILAEFFASLPVTG